MNINDPRISRKRKDLSPIKSMHDYNKLLRKQEVSASPLLKKHRALKPNPTETGTVDAGEVTGGQDAGEGHQGDREDGTTVMSSDDE